MPKKKKGAKAKCLNQQSKPGQPKPGGLRDAIAKIKAGQLSADAPLATAVRETADARVLGTLLLAMHRNQPPGTESVPSCLLPPLP